MARILVTGGSSYVGRHLVPLALRQHDVVYTYFQNDPLALPNGRSLDLRSETAVSALVQQEKPDVIIHLAGSNRPTDMTAVIIAGTTHVAHAAQQHGARLIHISTDSVFSGTTPPYAESASPDPVNEYGRAKAQAEALVQPHPNHVIVRTSLVYGLQEMDHGTAWMATALAAGEQVTLFTNQMRNPVWVQTLCAACVELAENTFTGILNVAGRQALSRAQFAQRMLDYWQVSPRRTLVAAPSPPDRWPLDCTLDLSLATAVLQTPLPGVDEVLTHSSAHP